MTFKLFIECYFHHKMQCIQSNIILLKNLPDMIIKCRPAKFRLTFYMTSKETFSFVQSVISWVNTMMIKVFEYKECFIKSGVSSTADCM